MDDCENQKLLVAERRSSDENVIDAEFSLNAKGLEVLVGPWRPVRLVNTPRDKQLEQRPPAATGRGALMEEAREQLRVAAPIIGMNLVQMLLVLTSAAFVGHVGPLALASCQLATSLASATGHYLLIGMALGLETLGGRAFGAGQLSELGHATYRCTLLLTAIACVVSLCWFQAEPILIFLGQEKTLAKVAARYMHLLIPSLFANAWTQPLVKFLQSQGVTAPLACCAVVALVFHVPNNWFFVFYLKLGLDGAAIATSLAYTVMFLCLAVHVCTSKRYAKARPRWSWAKASRGWMAQIRLGVPSTVMLCLEYWAFDCLYLMCGMLPNPYLLVSALSVAMNTAWLMSMTYVGLGAATSTRVAAELGAGSTKGAKTVARVGLTSALVLGCTTSVMVLASSRWWPLIFIKSTETSLLKLTSTVMMFIAGLSVVDSIQNNAGGIMRGCGRQGLGAAITLGSYYLVGLPASAFMTFHLGFGVFGLLGGLGLAVLCQATCLSTLIARTDWKQQVATAKASVAEITGIESLPLFDEKPVASEAAAPAK